MAFKYHFVFVGVNKGVGGAADLEAAERDAEELARAFRDLGLGGGEPTGSESRGVVTTLVGEEATASKVLEALDAVGECHDCDLLLVFWAGHFPRDTGLLATTDLEAEKGSGRVRLADLTDALLRSRATNRVLLLDVCYAGRVIKELLARMSSEWDRISDHRKDETLYVLTSVDSNSQSFESGRLGQLAKHLITELDKLKPNSSGWAELGLRLDEVYEALQKPDSLKRGGPSISIMVRRSVLPYSPGEREPLEQAMAYAVRAFKDYLNAKVVKNVEVIYFLAYDVWDGCLVYDGLVHGSVEHRLLEYIRTQFLDSDRLRSRFEEFRVDYASNSGYPRTREPGAATPLLGAAGQCFADALNHIREHPDDDPVQSLWYVGGLNYYESEYRAFDRLLGLGSCLYIPVVGRLVHGSLRDEHERPPLGGILMAGSREPYGLRPVSPELEKQWADARDFAQNIKPYEPGISDAESKKRLSDINLKDIGVAKALVRLLPGPKETDAREPAHRTPTEIENFLQCIGGVYAQRAKQRSRLRRIMHPQAVKGVARALEQHEEKALHAKQIEEIARKAEHERAVYKINEHPLNWLSYLETNKVGRIRPDDWPNGADGLTWTYVTALAWRDLRLAAQNTEDSVEKAAAASTASDALKLPAPEPGQNAENWDYYIEERAGNSDRISTDDPTYEMREGDSTVFHLRQVRRLIDDLRDFRDDPFTLLLQQLRTLAPIDDYMEGIAEVEAVLASSEREEYLRHLAHTVQVWMLGAWILESRGEDSVREMDRAGAHIRKFLSELAHRKHQEGPPRANGWFSGERLALFWGLLAAMHDLAEPVQRFAEWSQKFLERYFGGWSIHLDLSTPVLLDVLHHPRYPFYKNAITSLYPERERNWLESVFYAELVKSGHPISGSLILVHEMVERALKAGSESENEHTMLLPQPQMWRRISDVMRAALDRVENTEEGLLLPAYLAHGIAFSHLEEIKTHWTEQFSSSDYHSDVPERFHVVFEQFPLTYLMGLCEVLLTPTETRPLEPWITFVGSDPYGGLSPFFASKVQMQAPGASGHGTSADPTIVITIALWLDGLQRETLASFEQDHITQLLGKFDDEKPKEWQVLNYEDYHESRAKAKQPAPLPHSDATSWQKQSGGPLHVARPAYEIIRMVKKLEEFKKHYRSRRGVEVRFKNVDDGSFGVVLAPSPPAPDVTK